ncbi:HD domain-containing protein [Thalassobacillus sp. CUG 92003]|uniref:HD domain-containing protein n=1 Tax=Thalassobacillus sp. CUG 92003 TaxID=2736641 RepID=UPI0015E6B40A|nr:HD domain-containing protein [Thalassobacillus sp. CUG 92003]
MIEKAKQFATKAHHGQKRKSSEDDYIVHPIRVAHTLSAAGCAESVVCAGYLHDVVEDTSITLNDIEREFGNDVKQLVAAHTEDKSKSWKARKQHTIATVQTGSRDVKYLIVADKLDNLLSMEAELHLTGESMWVHFSSGYEQQRWYNQAIVDVMYNGLPSSDIPAFFHEYEAAVRRFFP